MQPFQDLDKVFTFFRLLGQIVTLIREYVGEAEVKIGSGPQRRRWVMKRFQRDFKLAGMNKGAWRRLKPVLRKRIDAEVAAQHEAGHFVHSSVSEETSQAVEGLNLSKAHENALTAILKIQFHVQEARNHFADFSVPEKMRILKHYLEVSKRPMDPVFKHFFNQVEEDKIQEHGAKNFGFLMQLVGKSETCQKDLNQTQTEVNLFELQMLLNKRNTLVYEGDPVVAFIIGILR